MLEVLALVLAAPLLVLVLGVIFFSLSDFGSFLWWLVLILVLLFALIRGSREPKVQQVTEASTVEQLEKTRRTVIAFSITALLPIFVRYEIFAFNESLIGIIIGLAIGFGIGIWGMFIKDHKALMYSNLIGGGLIVLYVYTQLWELGEGPRIIAAAVGLVIAVVISIIKLRDRLA